MASPPPRSPWNRPPPRGGGRGPLWLWLAAGGVGLALLVFLLARAFPEIWAQEGTRISVVSSLGFAVLIGSSLIVRWRARPGIMFKHAAIWGAVFVVLLSAFSFKDDAQRLFDRMRAELLPHRGQAVGGTLLLRARDDGHFVVQALVDGVPIRFLVDTGASDVVLSPRDAERLGLDPSRLNYSRVYRTANGTVRGAPVVLGRVSAGPISLRDVRASVNQAPLSSSLLGMSFLGRLSGYSVDGDKLTLRR